MKSHCDFANIRSRYCTIVLYPSLDMVYRKKVIVCILPPVKLFVQRVTVVSTKNLKKKKKVLQQTLDFSGNNNDLVTIIVVAVVA